MAGVGVAVTLMVLGLAAPASAAPAVTAISPTSGPLGCVVVITGTGFDQPGAFAVDTVNFTGAGGIDTAPADFHVVSDTEIWTTVPAAPVAATTGAITVTDVNGDSANSPVFTVTTGTDAGGCAPTIASFTPTCGVVGTVVTITGTNLLAYSGEDVTPTDPDGADVLFNPYTTDANHTGATESPTTLVVNVSGNAVDGPIRVSTEPGAGNNTVDSATAFDVVTDPTECGTIGEPTEHARNVTLRLRRHLIARGRVTVGDDFAACAESVRVKIQRRASGGWRTVRFTTTTSEGRYAKRLPDRPGRYRAVAPRVVLDSEDVCLKDVSPRQRHRH